MRTTRQAIWLYGAGIPLTVLLVASAPALWPLGLAYLGVAVALTAADMFLCIAPAALAFDVQVPSTIHVGAHDALIVRIRLRSPKGRSLPLILACDLGPDLVPAAHQRAIVTPGAAVPIEIPLVAERRGEKHVIQLWLRWPGPLGLIARVVTHRLDARVAVIPNIRAIRSAALHYDERDAIFGTKVQHQRGSGAEFDALRDYLPGFDHRSIDWKHSARHRRLVCKEYRTERNHHVMLAIDTGQLMSEPVNGVSKLDHAINAALMLGYFSLRAGDRVGVLGFDARPREYAAPSGDVRTFAHLQKTMSRLAYSYEETNFTLALAELAARLGRRSLVVLMTDFVDTVTAELMVQSLARMQKRHLVLFVTLRDPAIAAAIDAEPRRLADVARAVAAEDFAAQRRLVLERLHRLGVHCLDVPSHALSIDLLNRYLAIKQQGLI